MWALYFSGMSASGPKRNLGNNEITSLVPDSNFNNGLLWNPHLLLLQWSQEEHGNGHKDSW